MSIDEFGTEKASEPQERVFRISREDSYDGEPEAKPLITTMSQWAPTADGSFMPTGSTVPKLPAGAYSCFISQQGPGFFKEEINVDEMIRFQGSITDQIIIEIKSFWETGDKFKQYGFLHKKGYMFYGPPGGGKTILVQMIMADVIAADGIVVYAKNPTALQACLSALRKIEPTRPVVCVFEDLDAIVHEFGEDVILSLLDGEGQINNLLNVATTNYPEKLDKRIVSRPRRFDRVVKIDAPNANTRREYFQKKFHLEEENIEEWVKVSEGFSFAALAELVISTKCLGMSLSDSVTRLKELVKRNPSSDEYDGHKMGFDKE